MVRMDFSNFIKNPGGGIMLIGKAGSGVLPQAISLATDICNYGRKQKLSAKTNPDLHLIDLEEGARSIKMGQLEIISTVGNKLPMYSRCHVFVIGHADSMSEPVQNQLLKILEDGAENNVVILCCEKRMLETICNRCSIVTGGRGVSIEELSAAADKFEHPESTILALCDNRYEWIAELENKKEMSVLLAMLDSVRNLTEARNLMFSLDVMSEENANAFVKRISVTGQLALLLGIQSFFFDIMFFKGGTEAKYLRKEELATLSNIYDSEWLIKCLSALTCAIDNCKQRLFTQNDYFLLARTLADREAAFI